MLRLDEFIKMVKFNHKEDELIWKPSSEPYSVKAGIEALQSSPCIENLDWHFIWKFKVPAKVMLFS